MAEENTHYVNNKTGKQIFVESVFPHSGYDTDWEWINMCHVHIIISTYHGYWKYVKESTIDRLYTKVEKIAS